MNHKEPFALSDAIRIGAAIRPQAFHGLFVDGKSCALGAAAEAVAGGFECSHPFTRVDDGSHEQMELALLNRYPGVFAQRVECPDCPDYWRRDLDDQIVHLNDKHRWTREAIADFVAQVEERIGYETITCEQSESLSSTVIGVGV